MDLPHRLVLPDRARVCIVVAARLTASVLLALDHHRVRELCEIFDRACSKAKRKRRSVFLSFHKKISQTRDFRRAERKKKGMDDPLHLAPLIAVPPSFFVRLNIWRN